MPSCGIPHSLMEKHYKNMPEREDSGSTEVYGKHKKRILNNIYSIESFYYLKY